MRRSQLCIFNSCSSNSCLSKPQGLRLHRFPTTPNIKKLWERWVRDVGGPNCKAFVATKSTQTICGKHFKRSDYVNFNLNSKAVPSIPPEAPANGHPVQDNEPSQQPGKSRLQAQDQDPRNFQCPVKAQESLNSTADELARTKKRVQNMHLKYIRATRKINTLMEILEEFKEGGNHLDDDVEIKVCSSCRGINVFQ